MIVDAVPSRAAAGIVPSPWMPPAKIPTGQRTRRQRIFGSLAASNLQGWTNQVAIRVNQGQSEDIGASEDIRGTSEVHQRPSEAIRALHQRHSEVIR